MKKVLAFFSVAVFQFLVLVPAAFAANGLWVEGKDRPGERVNVDVKTLTPDVYLKVAEKVDRAVVNISTTQVVKTPKNMFRWWQGPGGSDEQPEGKGNPFEDFFGNDFFEKFFGGPMPQPSPRGDSRQQSLGSGFILNPDGYIVTNNHVIEKADEIKVVLSDESEYVAKIVGRDPKTDVALIKIDPKGKLNSVILGDSDSMKVGDIVVAIGNPFGLSHSVTQGIVSAQSRAIGFGPYDDFIQTDASINPGNSGGPLLNLQGEVIGINTAIVASGQGIGFAIPINLAKSILIKLKDEGRVIRGWLGVLIQKITDEHAKALNLKGRTGALVADVQADSPAEEAGVKAGDVIVRYDGKEVKSWSELPLMVANTKVGDQVKLEVVRDGKKKIISVKIQELKDQDGEKASKEDGKTDKLGLKTQDLSGDIARSLGIDPDTKGVLVGHVDVESPAYGKGIRRGDIILEVNRKKTSTRSEYLAAIKDIKKGSSVLLLVKRGSGTLFVAFTL